MLAIYFHNNYDTFTIEYTVLYTYKPMCVNFLACSMHISSPRYYSNMAAVLISLKSAMIMIT